MGDRAGSAQGEPLVLQWSPIVSVSEWVVVSSTFMGLFLLAIVIIWRLLTDASAYRLVLHRWHLRPMPGSLEMVSRNLAAVFLHS